MNTFASLFSGCGGADVGAIAAGLSHLWGIEVDARPAAIAQRNGLRSLVQDVLNTKWSALDAPDYLHASPPCVRASRANHGSGETDLDMQLALATVKAIRTLQPRLFTLENVMDYRNFGAFRFLLRSLDEAGYAYRWAVLNAADYGAAQTRERLFLIASTETMPTLPPKTHSPTAGQYQLFSDDLLLPWVGWKEAIAHLPAPKETQLSEAMLDAIPCDFIGEALVSGFVHRNKRSPTIRRPNEPAPTLTSSMSQPTTRPHIIRRNWHGDVQAQVLDRQHMAALMGFPPSFEWLGGPADFAAIGNAVCSVMIQSIVQSNILECAIA